MTETRDFQLQTTLSSNQYVYVPQEMSIYQMNSVYVKLYIVQSK